MLVLEGLTKMTQIPASASNSSMSISPFNAEAAQDRITDWLTEVSGHELWLKEQLSDTKQRYGNCENCLRQADRLKKSLELHSSDVPTQQQFELVEALKHDFGKAVSKLQDDLVINQQSGNQSLEQMKKTIQHYMDQNQELANEIEKLNNKNKMQFDDITNLRDENERLERLRDLLMQQQDNFTQRLSEVMLFSFFLILFILAHFFQFFSSFIKFFF